VHEGLRTICVPLSMPEAEVHARGEDCKDEDLKAVHAYLETLSVGICSRIVTYIPYDGGVYEIHLRNFHQ